VKNGKLEKIESEAKLSGYISYGNQHFGVSLELKTICTFASYTGTDDNNISI